LLKWVFQLVFPELSQASENVDNHIAAA